MSMSKSITLNSIVVIILYILLLSGSYISCKNKSANYKNNNISDKIGIIITDKAILRVDPILYSSVIDFINKGEKVTIADRSKEKERINNNENYWYNVIFSNNIKGWIFGSNIKIFSADKTDEMKRYLNFLSEEDLANLSNKLAGRWEINENDSIPGNNIEIFNDGKYISYSGENTIEGEYSINSKTFEIILHNGSHFGNKINYFTAGNGYLLKKITKSGEIMFNRMSLKSKNPGEEVNNEKSK